MSAAPPLRVLVISHNCVGESNRKRIDALAAIPGVQVALLTPRRWFEEGRMIELPDPQQPTVAIRYQWRVANAVATNNGTRHFYPRGLFALVRHFQPDVIDLHEEPFSFVALQTLIARALFAPKAALVFCSYVNVNVQWNRPYRWVERLLLRKADAAYAPNTDVPEVLHAKGMRAQVKTIPSGVDIDRFATAQPQDLRSRLDNPEGPIVGFLGRLDPVKGLDYLFEAIANLHHPGTFVIAGDGPERQHLEQLATDKGIQHRVRFLPGMPFNEVPGFIRALDALVLCSVTIPPTHKEQFGRVLTEAMAAGVPVLGSTSGAIPEVIGDAGLVVPERDSVALTAALDRLLSEPELRAELALKGRQRVSRYYGWPVVAQQAVSLYQTAIARRRQRADAGSVRTEVRL